jgi:5-methylthioadenosine/S-adenosylhomocysteine deaminase
MTDLFLKDCLYVVTMDDDRRIIKNGAVAIEGNKIVGVGKSDELAKQFSRNDRVIDCSKMVVLPGLINTHNHSTQQLARGLTDNVLFPTWIHERVYPYENALTEHDAYLSAMVCCIECIKTGTTTFIDPGGYHMDHVAKAVEESGIRAVLSRSAIDIHSNARVIPEKMRELTDNAAKSSEEFVRKYNGAAQGRIRAWFAPRTERVVSTELLRKMDELADRYRTGITIHVSSTQDAVMRHKELFRGKRPVERCKEAGILGPNLLIGEANWLSDEEIKLVKENDVKVFEIPSGSFHGAYGSIQNKHLEMMKEGVTVSLGNDTPCESNFNDMFRVMYCVTARRDYNLDPTLVPAEQILEMCIVNGAKAALWEDEIGSIRAGKKADMILIDIRRPEWTPILNPISNLVHSACGDSVTTSIINGKVVMENHELKTVDEQRILEEANMAASEIMERAGLTQYANSRWPTV